MDTVVKTLKASVAPLDAATVQGIMMTHYKTMRLVDDQYQWVAPELAEISDQLLPPTTTAQDAIELIDEMADAVSENPYMMRFFRATWARFRNTRSKNRRPFHSASRCWLRDGSGKLDNCDVQRLQLDRSFKKHLGSYASSAWVSKQT